MTGGNGDTTAILKVVRQEPMSDNHVELFGKKSEDVVYSNELCPFCNTRIDEFGLCGCIAGTTGAD